MSAASPAAGPPERCPVPKPPDPVVAARKVAEFDARLAKLRDEMEAVADRRARVIAGLVAAPGQSVRRVADVLGLSPTAVQKAVARAGVAAGGGE